MKLTLHLVGNPAKFSKFLRELAADLDNRKVESNMCGGTDLEFDYAFTDGTDVFNDDPNELVTKPFA